ncbi:hypothetical protein [Streptomyces tropicalis]|uniref:Uncharacterized protein n=1 Tax=Streptomyces tropicalis TaxID=3034234 RepID=A0ABT6AE79_9ACTN|nr:hypothetical protein [Streptomyces tropicalis]MDF3302952.1 hypothetical protein [Streptomyces tropicalis]
MNITLIRRSAPALYVSGPQGPDEFGAARSEHRQPPAPVQRQRSALPGRAGW